MQGTSEAVFCDVNVIFWRLLVIESVNTLNRARFLSFRNVTRNKYTREQT